MRDGASRKQLRSRKQAGLSEVDQTFYNPQKEVKFKPKTEAQREYAEAIENKIITFGIGPAGTGKTFVAAAKAIEMLNRGVIDNIILTRPGVEAEEEFGFLPGDLNEKYAPYLEPFVDIFEELLGKSKTKNMMGKQILAKPIAFLRGKTFARSFCILDEAQNTTPKQMKLFLTRVGQNSKVVIDGDLSQKDIKAKSGLQDGYQKIKHIPQVGYVEFSLNDCVRSGIVRDILYAYQK